jgi:hypothetical protein
MLIVRWLVLCVALCLAGAARDVKSSHSGNQPPADGPAAHPTDYVFSQFA